MPGSANIGNPVGIRWASIVFVRVHPPSEARRRSADNSPTIELRANELLQDTPVGHGQPALDQGRDFRVTSAAHFLCDQDEREIGQSVCGCGVPAAIERAGHDRKYVASRELLG